MNKKKFLGIIIALFLSLLFFSSVKADQNVFYYDKITDSVITVDFGRYVLDDQLKNEISKELNENNEKIFKGTEFKVVSERMESDWGLFTVLSIDGLDCVDELKTNNNCSKLFLAKLNNQEWKVYINGSEDFSIQISKIQDSISSKISLLDENRELSLTSSSSVFYQFPWVKGNWEYWNGFGHSNCNNCIDVGVHGLDADRRVLTAADGVISNMRECNSSYVINVVDSSGTELQYWHLENQNKPTWIKLGEKVKRGQILGKIKQGKFFDGVCGYAEQSDTAAHLHWVVPNDGTFIIDGWTLGVDSVWRRGTETRKLKIPYDLLPSGNYILLNQIKFMTVPFYMPDDSWPYLIYSSDYRVRDITIDDNLTFDINNLSCEAFWYEFSKGDHKLLIWYEYSEPGSPLVSVYPWPVSEIIPPTCAAFSGQEPPSVIQSDAASFISAITLPDRSIVSPEQSLVKTWRLKNTGSTTWGTGYKLVFVSGEQMGAQKETEVPFTEPNQTVDISVPIKTPSINGEHTGYFQLRTAQGTYFGPKIYVKINVKSSSLTDGNISVFDMGPVSPSEASSVHLLARVKPFPDFRSMRFVIENNHYENPNFKLVGDQYEISMDWTTGSLPRGTYTISLEVAKVGDDNWTNPERLVKTYQLIGTPASTNRPPLRPTLKSPYNWYLADAAGSSTSVQMCVNPSSDPDGDMVQYYFELNNGAQNSGWITNACWTPTLSPGGYSWRVKTGDGKSESDWSSDTWNFTVAKGGVYIGDINLFSQNTNDTHICVLVNYDGIIAPDVRGWINLAPDGSENGEWKLLDHYGPNTTPDCTQLNVHGFWIRSPEYITGNHKIRINAYKPDSGANETKTSSYNIAYIRPSNPTAISPSTITNNGTWWNTRTINFS